MADSPSPRSPDSPPKTADKPTPFWLWPHVLSLEAPLVAVVWALALGRLHQVPWWPGVLPGLALCVWTIYLADRTLDSLATPMEHLDVRHQFYRRHRFLLLGAVLPACFAGLVWLGLWVIPAGLMWQCLALGMLVTLYLALYTARKRRVWHVMLIGTAAVGALTLLNAMPLAPAFRLPASVLIMALLALLLFPNIHRQFIEAMPKEAAGGLLFALGCSTWLRFVGTAGASWFGGGLEMMLLTALFTSNLTGITDRELEIENPGAARKRHHPTLLVFVGSLCVALIYGATRGLIPERVVPLAWAVGGGVLLLAILHNRGHRLSAEAYRVLADLAVLAPAVVVLIVKTAGAGEQAACCLP